MPELPEVEVTRRRLSPYLLGRTIERVETSRPSYFFLTPPARLRQRLAGRHITALDRRGKYLLLALDDASRVLLHLGMTGQLFTETAKSPRLITQRASKTLPEGVFHADQHTHLVLHFTDARERVYFRDVRKFGKVLWLAPGQSDARLDRLGTDALTATADELHQAARSRQTPVKSLLLDQSVIAGAGNIYADEALFLAGIRPTRPAAKLSLSNAVRLIEVLQRVLLRSIETGGSSISDYVTPDGSDGGYQNERRVYARTGEPCRSCGTPIRRVVIAQRSTHYCPSCQR